MENITNDDKELVYDPEIITWQVPEFEKHDRTKNWYIGAIIVSIFLVIYAVLTKNFLFFGIIVIGALVVILNDNKEPELVRFSLTDEGIEIGAKFFDYDEIKNFSIVYKPKIEVKNLYFEYKNAIKPRLSVPLTDRDPIAIRQKLLKYLAEDLERTNQPLSEGLAKLFKL